MERPAGRRAAARGRGPRARRRRGDALHLPALLAIGVRAEADAAGRLADAGERHAHRAAAAALTARLAQLLDVGEGRSCPPQARAHRAVRGRARTLGGPAGGASLAARGGLWEQLERPTRPPTHGCAKPRPSSRAATRGARARPTLRAALETGAERSARAFLLARGARELERGLALHAPPTRIASHLRGGGSVVATYVVLVSFSEEGRKQLVEQCRRRSGIGDGDSPSSGGPAVAARHARRLRRRRVVELDAALMPALHALPSRASSAARRSCGRSTSRRRSTAILRWDNEHGDQGKLGP